MMSHMNLITCTSRVLSGAVVRPVLDIRVTGRHYGNTQQSVHRLFSKCFTNSSRKSLTMENLNPNVIKIEYAVRGPLVIRATKIEEELKKGAKKPFDKVIRANIGDAHAMGQKPITFIRQVLACMACPNLIDTSDFPCDVKHRACELLQYCEGLSAGSYTSSYGIKEIRQAVATYIEQRDGYKSDYNNIALTNGASTAIKRIMQMFCNNIDGKESALMIPIPQYPLYSALLSEFGLAQVRYYLDEERGWALTEEELERRYKEGSKKYNVRALVIINPGNPTGQVLTRENIELVVKFAHSKNLLIFADEVYQYNVYAKESKFFSFKKVMSDMGDPYDKMELASFMTVSKGYTGECGLRGGWVEVWNFDPKVQANLYKSMTPLLCANSLGQVAVHCVTQPPKKGDESYDLFTKEKAKVLSSLAERAKMIVETFNQMDGFSCNAVQGAMYAFPQIKLPPKAIETAEAAGVLPDLFYAFKLLEETGICIVPGSGFGQKPGTWHFRTTILPQVSLIKDMLAVFQKFHTKFITYYKEYA